MRPNVALPPHDLDEADLEYARLVRSRSAAPKPRRTPARRTGEQIVQSILDAAEALLGEVALDQMRIAPLAKRAGVSVGSLYQYFPNLEAVYAELGRRQERRSLEAVEAIHALLPTLPPEESVRRLLDAMLGDQLGAPRFRSALRRAVPRGWLGTEHERVHAMLQALLRELGERVPGAPPAAELAERLRLGAHAAEGVMTAGLLHDTSLLDNARVQEEVFRMVWSYVFGPR